MQMENFICMILLEQKKKRASRLSNSCTVVNFVSFRYICYRKNDHLSKKKFI